MISNVVFAASLSNESHTHTFCTKERRRNSFILLHFNIYFMVLSLSSYTFSQRFFYLASHLRHVNTQDYRNNISSSYSYSWHFFFSLVSIAFKMPNSKLTVIEHTHTRTHQRYFITKISTISHIIPFIFLLLLRSLSLSLSLHTLHWFDAQKRTIHIVSWIYYLLTLVLHFYLLIQFCVVFFFSLVYTTRFAPK